jgi:hypothetical protein
MSLEDDSNMLKNVVTEEVCVCEHTGVDNVLRTTKPEH